MRHHVAACWSYYSAAICIAALSRQKNICQQQIYKRRCLRHESQWARPMKNKFPLPIPRRREKPEKNPAVFKRPAVPPPVEFFNDNHCSADPCGENRPVPLDRWCIENARRKRAPGDPAFINALLTSPHGRRSRG